MKTETGETTGRFAAGKSGVAILSLGRVYVAVPQTTRQHTGFIC